MATAADTVRSYQRLNYSKAIFKRRNLDLREYYPMLTKIERRMKSNPPPEGAVRLLLGCHDRIRHFTEMADRLASNPHSPAGDRQEAARAVLRYYEMALPLHEADENESIYPRLQKRLPPGELAEANQAMIDQHTQIDALIAQLLPVWRTIGEDPAEQERLSPHLQENVHRLQQLWTTHLRLEEEVVVPAMLHFLLPQDLGAIEHEMRARRQAS
jgi:hemerythrin-like domain-containing protein